MSIGIGENISGSFGFAKDRLVGKWLDWIILIILCIIPIIGWLLLLGFIVRVYRGDDPKLGEWIKMFVDGILLAIIGIVYMIIPAIVACIFDAAAILTTVDVMNPTGSFTALTAGVGIVGIIITLIIAIVFSIMLTMAAVRFAKEESFGAAFQFGEIFKIVGKIGWLHYILSWIVLAIIFAVVYFIVGLIMSVIPVLATIILWIIFPIMAIWEAKFFARLYESA